MVHLLASRRKSVAASRPAIAARDAAPPIALPGWHWAVQGGHCVRVTRGVGVVCVLCAGAHMPMPMQQIVPPIVPMQQNTAGHMPG